MACTDDSGEGESFKLPEHSWDMLAGSHPGSPAFLDGGSELFPVLLEPVNSAFQRHDGILVTGVVNDFEAFLDKHGQDVEDGALIDFVVEGLV